MMAIKRKMSRGGAKQKKGRIISPTKGSPLARVKEAARTSTRNLIWVMPTREIPPQTDTHFVFVCGFLFCNAGGTPYETHTQHAAALRRDGRSWSADEADFWRRVSEAMEGGAQVVQLRGKAPFP
jgi:hypothetical protein